MLSIHHPLPGLLSDSSNCFNPECREPTTYSVILLFVSGPDQVLGFTNPVLYRDSMELSSSLSIQFLSLQVVTMSSCLLLCNTKDDKICLIEESRKEPEAIRSFQAHGSRIYNHCQLPGVWCNRAFWVTLHRITTTRRVRWRHEVVSGFDKYRLQSWAKRKVVSGNTSMTIANLRVGSFNEGSTVRVSFWFHQHFNTSSFSVLKRGTQCRYRWDRIYLQLTRSLQRRSCNILWILSILQGLIWQAEYRTFLNPLETQHEVYIRGLFLQSTTFIFLVWFNYHLPRLI